MVMITNEEPNGLTDQTFQILAVLYPHELDTLQSVAHSISIPAGTTMIEEGQDNQSLYFVKSGTLRVSKKHHDFTFEIGSITPGEIFGEASILHNTPATADVHSIDKCELYQVNIKHVHEIFQDNSRFNHALQQLSERRSAAGGMAINPIFSFLPQTVREVILYNGEYISLSKRDVLFHEGENNSEHIYIILSGTAEASIQHPLHPSQQINVATFTTGDDMGTTSIITGKSHITTIMATSTLRLFKIRSSSLQPYLQRYSDFKHALRHSAHKNIQHKLEALRQEN